MFSCFGFCSAVLPVLRFFLPFLCLAFAFMLKGLPCGVLCILLCCNFFFYPCYMQHSCVLVFLCACLQVYLCGSPVLVSVRCFPCSPFASFACFCWALKALIHVPYVHPSTSRPSVSPALLCRFCVCCVHGMAEFSAAATICVPPSPIPVTHYAPRHLH